MVIAKKIGAALTQIHNIIKTRDNVHIIHTSEIGRAERELLLKNRWLEEIIQGWYLVVRPDQQVGDTSAWYANFWDFLVLYLQFHYGDNYCLSAEHSIDIQLGRVTVPKQVIVIAEGGKGSPIDLPYDTSLLVYKDPSRIPKKTELIRRLEVMPLPFALCKVSPAYFKTNAQEAQIALKSIADPHLFTTVIIENDFQRAAGRIVGAYRHLGENKTADTIKESLKTYGMKITEVNPFDEKTLSLYNIQYKSPYALRIAAMWQNMRRDVLKYFPTVRKVMKSNLYLEHVEELYTQDAYHSLSIEGYQVSKELIQKVIDKKWRPEHDLKDREEHNALAARGYYEAFEEVKLSLKKVLTKKQAAKVVESDLEKWYQKLFAPMVRCGILSPTDLLGYRKSSVYIRNSRHTPLPKEHLRDAMESYFDCLHQEKEPAVAAVLGHFIFEYIHPYMDGNGRIGRFLMNVILASGGYPWTIITFEKRREYLAALEKASVEGNIIPLTRFIANQMRATHF